MMHMAVLMVQQRSGNINPRKKARDRWSSISLFIASFTDDVRLEIT